MNVYNLEVIIMGLRDLTNVLPVDYMLKVASSKPELVDWTKICYTTKMSESFIEKYKNWVDWHYVSNSQKLSEEFIDKYRD